MFNQNSYYRNYPRFSYNNRPNNFFATNPFAPNFMSNNNFIKKNDIKTENIEQDLTNLKKDNEEDVNDTNENLENKNCRFSLGPVRLYQDEISLFGFTIQIDDLIIVGLILLLLIETECDYGLIIILGLMLFNINFSSLNLF